MKKIVVIGAGGVGGYFGGKMAQAGLDVTFVARGNTFKALKENGLSVKSNLGDFKVENVQVVDEIAKIETADLILLGVKAWQVKEIAGQLPGKVSENTVVLPLQNGVLAAGELKQFLPERNVMGGLCRILSKIEAPGVIEHFGITPAIVFGELNHSISQRAKDVGAVFENAGIQSILSDDIHVELWKKFILICVSALLAVTRTNYGEIRALPETREMMKGLLDEICKLAIKMDIAIPENYLEKTMRFIDTYPAGSNTSLTRDVLAGKPSELEYQNGTVVKLGKEFGVETPINSFVYHALLPMELKARGEFPLVK